MGGTASASLAEQSSLVASGSSNRIAAGFSESGPQAIVLAGPAQQTASVAPAKVTSRVVQTWTNLNQRDVEADLTLHYTSVPAASDVQVEVRSQADGRAYRLHVTNRAGKVALQIARTTGPAETVLLTRALTAVVPVGGRLAVRYQVVSKDPVSINASAWVVGSTPPVGWPAQFTDSSTARIGAAGQASAADMTAGGPTAEFDDLSIYKLTATESSTSPAPTTAAPSTSAAPTTSPAPTTAPRSTSQAPVTTAPSTTSVAPPTTAPKSTTPTPSTTASPTTTVTPRVAPSTTLINADFNSMASGAITVAQWNAAVAPTPAANATFGRMTVVNAGGTHGNVIRTSLAANTFGTANGSAFTVPLPAAVDYACMSYDVRFDANFDWSYGGKLPGLQGINPQTGVAPAGGTRQSDGWSGRLMWLGSGAYKWAGPNNMAVSYMYNPNQPDNYGQNLQWNKEFVRNTWHSVKECYTMNTPGKADGVLQAWMDGTLVQDNHAFVYRLSASVHANQIGWSLFRGGNTAAWAGTRNGYVDIDNLVVSGR